MDKKVTVKDVAKEAGVSVATVSYIMNDRKDQKISEATRTKVLQIANLLNYRPSRAAISLATGRTNVIGVAYCLDVSTPSRNQEILTFVNLFIERLNRMEYDILFLPMGADGKDIRNNQNIDAIIAIDLSHEQFKMLSEKYYVPVINVDMLVNDNLFFQIYPDYPKMIAAATELLGDDPYLLFDGFANKNFEEYIINTLSKGRILRWADIREDVPAFLNNKKVIVLGSYLALMVLPYLNAEDMAVISSEYTQGVLPAAVSIVHNDTEKKANLTMNILLNALNHKFDLNHDCKVR